MYLEKTDTFQMFSGFSRNVSPYFLYTDAYVWKGERKNLNIVYLRRKRNLRTDQVNYQQLSPKSNETFLQMKLKLMFWHEKTPSCYFKNIIYNIPKKKATNMLNYVLKETRKKTFNKWLWDLQAVLDQSTNGIIYVGAQNTTLSAKARAIKHN